MSDAVRMYRYNVWANERVLEHLRGLPEGTHRQSVQSVFPSIGDTLAHMYIVDNVWLCAMSGEFERINESLPDWQTAVQNASLDTFQTCFAEVVARYEEFFTGHPDLDAVSEYPHPTYGTLKATYADIIHHIVNHGTYHRGNITAMLRQLGHKGPSTDYVFYLYLPR